MIEKQTVLGETLTWELTNPPFEKQAGWPEGVALFVVSARSESCSIETTSMVVPAFPLNQSIR